jgi:hypothetical protein
MNTPIERMKKILALARRGVDGEKATAEAMLAKLLAKYNMTIADLEGEAQQVERHYFTYTTDIERRLLIQIVANITSAQGVHHWKRKGKRMIGFELTALQFAEVDVRYEAYRKPLQAELDKTTNRVYAAFVQANDLGVSRDDDDERPLPSMEDLAELQAIMALMQTMKPTPVHRQLESAS